MRGIISFTIFVTLFVSTLLFADEATVMKPKNQNSAKQCAVCHYEMINKVDINGNTSSIAPVATAKDVGSERMCFSCHDGSVGDSKLRVWDQFGFAHRNGVKLKDGMKAKSNLPLVDGEITCMTCHTAHGEQKGEMGDVSISNSLFLRVSNENSALCKSCHDDKESGFNHSLNKKVTSNDREKVLSLYGYISKKNTTTCQSCHVIHGADSKKLIIANDIDMKLCKLCHSDLFEAKNGIQTPHVSDGTPIEKEQQDIIKKMGGEVAKNGELLCYSCHKVHNAKNTSMLLMSEKGVDFCKKCHTSYDKVEDSYHDLTLIEGLKTADNKTITEVGVCGACHGGHAWRTTFKSDKTDSISQICSSCHSSSGLAKERAINLDMNNHFMGALDSRQMKEKMPKTATGLKSSTNEFFKTFLSKNRTVKMMYVDNNITCVTCHDVHNGTVMFLRNDMKLEELCNKCHVDKATTVKSAHGGEKVLGGCVSCHQVHNSPNKSLIWNDDKYNGCFSCHKDDGKGNVGRDEHGKQLQGLRDNMPKELLYKQHNHPTGIDNLTKFPEPIYNQPNGLFSCVTCHDPHKSENPSGLKNSLLRNDANVDNIEKFCTLCHEKEGKVIGTSHAVVKNSKVVNSRTGRTKVSCDNCHKVHGAFADKGIPSKEFKYSNSDDLCYTCHDKGGEAEKHVIEMNKGHKVGAVNKDTLDKLRQKGLITDFLTIEKSEFYIRCNNCHNPHINGPKANNEGDILTSYLKEFPNNKFLCINCHTKVVDVKLGGHGIDKIKEVTAQIRTLQSANDSCTYCHTTHNSMPEFLMKGKTDKERCMQCHEKGSVKSSTYVYLSHRADVDVKDKKVLPLSDKGEITCKTCHDSHISTAKLIRDDGSKTLICIRCHEEKKDILFSKHNATLSNIRDSKVKELAGISVCEPCHSSHSLDSKTSIPLGRDVNREFMIEDSCLSCHYKDGPSEKYVLNPRHPSMLKSLTEKRVSIENFGKYLYDSKGKRSKKGEIDCATCHDPHIWSSTPSKALEYNKAGMKLDGDNKTSFLRGNVSKEFCSLCHDDSDKWFDNFHSDKFREERRLEKRPENLLERMKKLRR